jgi:hypothetical protein
MVSGAAAVVAVTAVAFAVVERAFAAGAGAAVVDWAGRTISSSS